MTNGSITGMGIRKQLTLFNSIASSAGTGEERGLKMLRAAAALGYDLHLVPIPPEVPAPTVTDDPKVVFQKGWDGPDDRDRAFAAARGAADGERG